MSLGIPWWSSDQDSAPSLLRAQFQSLGWGTKIPPTIWYSQIYKRKQKSWGTGGCSHTLQTQQTLEGRAFPGKDSEGEKPGKDSAYYYLLQCPFHTHKRILFPLSCGEFHMSHQDCNCNSLVISNKLISAEKNIWQSICFRSVIPSIQNDKYSFHWLLNSLTR